MSPIPSGVVVATELKVGQPLSFDLVDQDDVLLCEAGRTIDQSLIDRAKAKGRTAYYRLDVNHLQSEHVRSELNRLFPEENTQRLQDVISVASQALATTVGSIRNKSNFKASTIVNGVSQIVFEATRDLQAVMVAFTLKQPCIESNFEGQLLDHATQLSTLSICIACMAGLDQRNVFEIGVAGLLHDLSLILRSESFDPELFKTNPDVRTEFQQHPLVTVALLKRMPGLSPESLQLMAQVHEQCDGSGYPQGLPDSELLQGAKILNLADAYLSLVRPLRGQPMVFSDALAYLCYHAAHGKFDRTIVKKFVKFMSMYPLGSVVELDDRTAAIVVGNNPLNPLAPKVSVRGQEVNLEKSKRMIERVATTGLHPARRVSKRRLGEIFWRLDA